MMTATCSDCVCRYFESVLVERRGCGSGPASTPSCNSRSLGGGAEATVVTKTMKQSHILLSPSYIIVSVTLTLTSFSRFALVTHLDATLLRKLCGSGQNIPAQDFLVFYGIYCFEMLKSQTTNQCKNQVK